MKKTELHWLAGLLEGEGSFQFTKRNAVVVSLGMTDRDVVYRAAEYFGKPIHKEERPLGRKVVYRTQCYGSHALALMMTIYGLMGERRKSQIKKVLLGAYGRLGRARGERNGNAKLCEKDVLEIRRLDEGGLGQRAIGRVFRLSHTQVGLIVNRKNWRHI